MAFPWMTVNGVKNGLENCDGHGLRGSQQETLKEIRMRRFRRVIPFASPFAPIATAVVICIPPRDKRIHEPLKGCNRCGFRRDMPQDRQNPPIRLCPETLRRVEVLKLIVWYAVNFNEPLPDDGGNFASDSIDPSPGVET